MPAHGQIAVGGQVAGGDLAHLREEALGNVLVFALIGWYGWCAVLFPGNAGFHAVW